MSRIAALHAAVFSAWRDDDELPDPVLDWWFGVAKDSAALSLMTDMALDPPTGLVEMAGKDADA